MAKRDELEIELHDSALLDSLEFHIAYSSIDLQSVGKYIVQQLYAEMVGLGGGWAIFAEARKGGK